MKRSIWLFALGGACILVTSTFAEEHGGRILWVKYDSEKGEALLSDGQALPQPMTPGQFVGFRRGGLRPMREWRPPQDIEKNYTVEKEARVVFSHERHFAALGVKDCKACHAEEKGLGTGKAFPSLAANVLKEPHAEKSEGRFCATCHKDNFTSGQIAGAKPSASVAIFSALGKTGDPSCSHCHAPADHGMDYTRGHGDRAEHGARRCAECHRGATAITSAELNQAAQFRAAQALLITTPDDKEAFGHTLPSNFCAYCHAADQKPWRGEHRERGEAGERGDD